MTHPRITFFRLLAVALLVCSCSQEAGPTGAWAGANADAGEAGAIASETGVQDGAGPEGAAGADGDSGAEGAAPEDGALPDGAVSDGAADDASVPDASGSDSPSGMTSCVSVAHIGDSLTYYTQPSLTAAYAGVGATVLINAYGGRAIKQKLEEDPMTGLGAVAEIKSGGFGGCWVVALGTNDTANIAAGAWYTRVEAIDEMMNAIDPAGGATVMWVNTYTTKTSGYYSNDNMVLWNQALVEAQQHWPNMEVFDWASIADDGTAPYSDGIHHTAAGYEVRNAAIAKALAGFFPLP